MTPYNEIITRAEVLERLHAQGYKATDRQLKSWVTFGILPRPKRQVPPGATDGIVRAVYPIYMVDVIADLLHRMATGHSREELKYAAPSIIMEYHMASLGQPSTEWLPAPEPSGPPPPRISRALMHALWDYAQQITEQRGQPVTSTQLIFRTVQGDPIEIQLGPPPKESKKNHQLTLD